MNKNLSYVILICAIAANTVHCYVPKAAAVPDYADGASSAAASSAVAGPTAEVITGPVQVYPQPAIGPAYGALPNLPAYGAIPNLPAYGAIPNIPAYGAIPNIPAVPAVVQPAGVAQLYPGPINYKVYNSPPEYSTVVLPVRPAGPAVKLFLPQNTYSANLGPAY